jgi:hypothetical protein
MAAPVKFHAGLTRELRRLVRVQGLSLGEHAAQVVLGGLTAFVVDLPEMLLIAARNEVLGQHRRHYMGAWERQFPGKDPYPPSFPEQMLELVRKAIQAVDSEGGPLPVLITIQDRCIDELSVELSFDLS